MVTRDRSTPVLPGMVRNFGATLKDDCAIEMRWEKPQTGGPVEGYKLLYWDKPGSVNEATVDEDVSDSTICSLK